MRPQRRHRGQPGRQQLRPVRRRDGHPTRRGSEDPRRRGRGGGAGRLQQRAALLEHPVVVGSHAGQPRGCAGRSESSRKRRRSLGITPHDREVLRREDTARTRRATSRARAVGAPFSRARFARPGVISTSTRSSARRSATPRPLGRWRVRPRCRTSGASVGGSVTAAGWPDSRAASTRFVLPCPFAPTQHRRAGLEGEFDAGPAAEVRRGTGDGRTRAATGSAGQPHRHDQVGVVAVELSGIARRPGAAPPACSAR